MALSLSPTSAAFGFLQGVSLALFFQNEYYFPRTAHLVLLNNTEESSGNEFGKGLWSVCWSHSKEEDLSVVFTASSSFEFSLAIKAVFGIIRPHTSARKRLKRATFLWAGFGCHSVLQVLLPYFSKWLQARYTRGFCLNLPLCSES